MFSFFIVNYLQADSKSEIDIQAAVKMPPLPGQSRSLLQFDGVNNDIADMNDFQENIETVETSPIMPGTEKPVMIKIEEVGDRADPPYSDHDYTYNYKSFIKHFHSEKAFKLHNFSMFK